MNDVLTAPLSRTDVLGTWAGLRPLVREASTGKTADLSRKHRVTTSTSGLITVTGGKLTTYREMARDAVDVVVDQIADRLGRRVRHSPTARLRLRGAEGWEEQRDRDPWLADRYGGEGRVVEAMIQADPSLGDPLVPGLPYRRAEAVYAARYEMATTLDDVLSRRTRARLLGRDATAVHAAEIADLVGDELGWAAGERAQQVAAYRRAADREREVPGLPETAALAPTIDRSETARS
jgi:glycerol-3-phosphate dehydrogenase